MKLQNKVAIITGGGGGLGEGMAKRFAKEGASVAIMGRRKHKVDEVAAAIEQSGGKALAIAGDVTKQTDVQNTVMSALETFGKIDILVNNAGSLFLAKSIVDFTDDDWQQTQDIFLTSTFRFIRAVVPHMRKQKCGSILNISSVAGLKCVRDYLSHAYSAAKAGVCNLTRTVAYELSREGIRCNCICPSGVITEGLGGVTTPDKGNYLADPAMMDYMNAIHPMGLGKIEYIANAALYYASDDSVWTTGTILPVDGGFMAI